MLNKPISPAVAIIVVGTNEIEWLDNCINSIFKSTYQNFNVIYIDNDSSDNSVEYITQMDLDITVIKLKKNKGFSVANNVGIEYALKADYKYILLLNPDTITPSNLILELVSFMELNLMFAISGPLQSKYNEIEELNNWSQEVLKNQNKNIFHHWISNKNKIRGTTNPPNIIHHAYVQGAAFMIRAETLKKIGLLETIYHTFYEETAMCRKARWLGYDVGVITNLRIHHYGGGGSLSKSNYRNFYYSRNKYIFLWTDPGFNFVEILSISTKWLINDFNQTFIVKNGDISNPFQLLKIILSLCCLVLRILLLRRKNKKEFRTMNSSNK